MKKRLISILFAVLIGTQSFSIFAKAKESSTPIAINEDNYAAMYKDTIYFKKSTYSDRICSLNQSLKGNTTEYNVNTNGNYHVAGDWIYYPASDMLLYRIKKDGTGNKKLTDFKTYVQYISERYIYYRKSEDSNLYRMNTDGSGQKSLGVAFESIYVKGDWIYYTGADDQKLYKINADGKGGKLLTKARITNITDIIGDWIYFRNKGLNICKVKTDGTGEQQLTKDSAGSVWIIGDWIYYNYYSYNSFKKTVSYGSINKVKTNGKGYATVLSGSFTSIDYIGNGWIYYEEFSNMTYTSAVTTLNSKIFRMKMDGSSQEATYEIIFCENNGFLYYSDSRNSLLYRKNIKTSAVTKVCDHVISNVNFIGDRIYYYEEMIDNTLYKMDAAGKTAKVSDAQIGSAYINGNYIYYDDLNDPGKLYRMKANGTGKVKVVDGAVKIVLTTDKYIYYYSDNYTLSRCSLDGKKKETVYSIFTNGKIDDIQAANGYLYYLCNKSIYRQKESSLDMEKIADYAGGKKFYIYNGWLYYDDCAEDYILKLNTDNLEKQEVVNNKDLYELRGLSDGKLYYSLYSNATDLDTMVYAYDINSQSSEKMCKENYVMNFSDGWIYYLETIRDEYFNEKESVLYRLDKPGNEKELLRCKIQNIVVVGDWIFCKVSDQPEGSFVRMKTDGTGKIYN